MQKLQTVNAETLLYEPVSYTHLDVYKRQIYSGTLHLRDVIRISEKEKIKITEMCVPTVSYTHLPDCHPV